jgi:hypothetical protein
MRTAIAAIAECFVLAAVLFVTALLTIAATFAHLELG